MNITKDEFIRYENLRLSGATNMYDIEFVMAVTWLSKEKVLYIMKNYPELYDKYIIGDTPYRGSKYTLNGRNKK